ncbi:hypothetical protein B0T18DRAFT_412430 [Schizothecium vesticola]|uniref:Mid2 domain-containing protein n=1 Tax=Schizothecium vesticola TaxID=314040 RepID=A0AA40K5M1_9PEZI|nr:hypothetical protein B0T18DRAFT_412430 [Schizothecium vesticola]
MRHLSMRTALPLLAYLSILLPPVALADHAAEVQCYAPDGQTVANSSLVSPCNNLGITQSGIHSSCCQLQGDESVRDLCTATGLCLSSGVVRRGFCTDKTWKNPTCVGVCVDKQAGGTPTGFAEMTSCTDGTYCCGRNNLTCCGTKWAIEAPSIISSVVMTTTTASAAPAKQNVGAIAGLGGALGAVILVAAGAIIYLVRRIKALKASLAATHVRDEPPNPMSGTVTPGYPPSQPPRSNLVSPAATAETEADFATLKAMYDRLSQQLYGTSRAQSPELDGSGYSHHRASELDGSTLAAAVQPLTGARETAENRAVSSWGSGAAPK